MSKFLVVTLVKLGIVGPLSVAPSGTRSRLPDGGFALSGLQKSQPSASLQHDMAL
ncbi:hypothetical protein AB4K05_10125 [Kluyvera sp. STS39-E]|uniref:hypothetical protein n=1 Tax=Kluyvera sp. STS39-E TaxID=3234748 RepID=UPI0034C6D5DB